MTDRHIILGVHVTDRATQVGTVQELLSKYGRNIKTRVGLHDVQADLCSPTGVILLELTGAEAECTELAQALDAVEGVETQRMIFEHPERERNS